MREVLAILAIVAMVLGGFALLAAIIAFSAIVNGWVLTHLWHWFMVPIFGLHDLTIAPAIGLGLIVSFLTNKGRIAKKDSRETDWGATIGYLLSPFVVLFFGYVVHLFM